MAAVSLAVPTACWHADIALGRMAGYCLQQMKDVSPQLQVRRIGIGIDANITVAP